MPSSRLAKLTRPRTDGLVSRPRLFSALDTACARPVVWIAGPPGAGKTSLVSSYLDARKRPCLWYQVDAGDADPATFFYYLGMAAAELGGRKHKPLPLFTEEFAADLEGFARRFFRALYAQLPADGVVVLDNYQEVPERAPFHAVVRIGAEELPEGVTLCSVSRIEPPGELARLRASQQLSAIGWEDLKLTAEETAAIAAEANPDDATLALLRDQSGGWAAGVVLMLERLRQTGGIRPGNTHENLETIFDYFAGQVFHAATRETQAMLLRMAFLPRLTAETAQVITGNPEAGKLLATLAKRNLFIDRRYGEQTTYQFHALFRAFLKVQAREVLSVAELQRVAHSVAALLQTTGEIEDAFQLLFEQGAWENIAELIKAHAASLIRQGRRQTVKGLIESLPGTTLNDDPWLLFWLGVASASPFPSQGRDLLEEAYRGFESVDDVVGMASAAIAEVDVTYRSTGDMTRLDRWLGRFSTLMPLRESELDRELSGKLLARYFRALCTRVPLSDKAQQTGEMLNALLESGLSTETVFYAAAALAVRNWVLGLPESNDRLIETMNRHPVEESDRDNPYVRLFRYFADFHPCSKLVFDVSPDRGDPNFDSNTVEDVGPVSFDYYRRKAHELILRRQYSRARRMLVGRIGGVIDSVRTSMRGFQHAHMATCALAEGDREEVLRQVHAAVAVHDLGPELSRLFATPYLGALLGAVGNQGEAIRMLNTLAADFDLTSSDWLAGRFGWCKAYVELKSGNLSEALAPMPDALARLSRVQYRSWIIFPDPDFDRLFALALEHDIEREFVTSLIRNHGIPAPDPDLDIWPWPLKLRLLGSFRIEGLPAGKSGKPQHKLNDLLKAIAVRGPSGVSIQALADELWPDSEGDAALNAAQVSLYRLRKMLSRDDAIRVDDGVVLLNREVCWVDAWAFERKGSALVAQRELDDRMAIAASEALRLYGGPLLSDSREMVWSLGAREHLRGIWTDLVRGLGRHHEGQGNWREADAHYRAALAIHPEVEEVHRGRLRCLQRQGAIAEAGSAYAFCREQLLATTGRPPSAETEKLYRQITA